MKFIKLFEPIKVKNVEIRNRIVMPAMALNFSRDGGINDTIVNFYVERAKGGAGLIIIGGAGVEPRGGGPTMFAIHDDKFIPGYTRFAEQMHKHGAKTIVQLYHAGAYSGMPDMVSSSAVMSNLTRRVPEELSIDEIKVVQESHAKAAERAREAGFDGVELLGSAGYLINQFLSPVTNKRTDEYGGSLENRLRYPLELIKLVKERVGKDIIVGMRVAGDDFVPGSNTYKESAIFAKHYADAGVEYINVTGGWHETRIPQIPMMVPQGAYAYLAENIRNNVNIPVFSSNRINSPIVAEQILRDQMADAVCMGRALIADPYLPLKSKDNKLWDIRKCVGCNQGCFDHIFTGRSVECMRNYEVSREGKIDIDKKSDNPQKLLIIGAGPGGLEAARVAKLLGHDVTIIEKNHVIGGQASYSWVPPGRNEIKDIMDYYRGQIEHLNIETKLGTEATAELINKYQPDAVIFATGVKYVIPNIKGIDGSLGSEIFLAEQILQREYPIGKNIVVVGGSATGMETAIWAAELGSFSSEVAKFLSFYDLLPREDIFKRWMRGNRKVTVIDMLPKLGMSIGRTSRGFLIGQLKKLGIDTILNTTIKKFDGRILEYEQDNESKMLENIDTFILATGVEPNDSLFNKVKESNPSFKSFKVGDCKKPRTMLEAIHEGFKVAYELDKK